MSPKQQYTIEFLRAIAEEQDTPEGKKLVASVPRYEVGDPTTKKSYLAVSKLEDFLNDMTMRGGRLVSVVPQGSGLVAPIVIYTDQFIVPSEAEETAQEEAANPTPADPDDAARNEWETSLDK